MGLAGNTARGGAFAPDKRPLIKICASREAAHIKHRENCVPLKDHIFGDIPLKDWLSPRLKRWVGRPIDDTGQANLAIRLQKYCPDKSSLAK